VDTSHANHGLRDRRKAADRTTGPRSTA